MVQQVADKAPAKGSQAPSYHPKWDKTYTFGELKTWHTPDNNFQYSQDGGKHWLPSLRHGQSFTAPDKNGQPSGYMFRFAPTSSISIGNYSTG